MVLYGLTRGSVDYIVLKPNELLSRLQSIHGPGDRLQTYIWTTEQGRCWETRGLKKADQQAIVDDGFEHPTRDFGQFLGCWACLDDLNRSGSNT